MVSAGLQSLIDHEDSLKSQLSAVISYQQTCKDGIKHPSIRAVIRLRLQTVTELTSDALAVAEARDGGYPTWFSATDRGLTENHRGTYVIYVKSGMYEENITLKVRWGTVSMYGDGPRKTIITGRKNCHDQFTTLRTATFSVRGKGFIARSMAFRNTAGPEGGQAVALQVQADMSAFFNCRIDGGRADDRQTTGFVIQNCRIVRGQELFPVRFSTATYLGRPWKRYSRTVVMESTLGDLIHPKGWLARNGTFAVDTLLYAEYANKGPGADTSGRVDWKGYKVITNRTEALAYTVAPFIQGDQWLKRSGMPFLLGLKL
ncbi:hypothetical protein AAG906_006420 [Vitis piasezkii]